MVKRSTSLSTWDICERSSAISEINWGLAIADTDGLGVATAIILSARAASSCTEVVSSVEARTMQTFAGKH